MRTNTPDDSDWRYVSVRMAPCRTTVWASRVWSALLGCFALEIAAGGCLAPGLQRTACTLLNPSDFQMIATCAPNLDDGLCACLPERAVVTVALLGIGCFLEMRTLRRAKVEAGEAACVVDREYAS